MGKEFIRFTCFYALFSNTKDVADLVFANSVLTNPLTNLRLVIIPILDWLKIGHNVVYNVIPILDWLKIGHNVVYNVIPILDWLKIGHNVVYNVIPILDWLKIGQRIGMTLPLHFVIILFTK